MIRVRRRSPAPAVLVDPDGVGPRERARALQAFAEHAAAVAAGTAAKPFKFRFAAYKHADVKRRLEEIFHGKCAYCESRYSSTQPMDVEHYRPKGSVADDDLHPGYYWLAAEWSNLLPSCIDCNRKRKQVDRATDQIMALGKQDQFPIDGQRADAPGKELEEEKPLLLEPCHGLNPKDVLEFEHELALVVPRATRGYRRRLAEESIRVYGLNRGELVVDRSHVLRLVHHRIELVDKLVTVRGRVQALLDEDGTGTIPRADLEHIILLVNELITSVLREVFEMRNPDRPYAGMARDVIARLGAHLEPGTG